MLRRWPAGTAGKAGYRRDMNCVPRIVAGTGQPLMAFDAELRGYSKQEMVDLR